MQNFWRMQLHPAETGRSIRYTIDSLSAGYIGLDFTRDPGNLMEAKVKDLPEAQRDYMDFATVMQRGDWVLVTAHHFPFALVKVAGDYNHIHQPEPKLGLWFRHFRKVIDIHYYADYETNAHDWSQFRMTDAIALLSDPAGQSYKLMARWLQDE